MRALTFQLSGSAACFKKPEVNAYAYFTYAQIHKVALLGLLGAVIGLKGYSQQVADKHTDYPEFYACLKDLKVAIVPTAKGEIPGVCSKKIQVFNNSVGYASKEEGGNLIIKEQWLEQPSWQIYILETAHPYFEKLKTYLIEKRCEFIPYLGKNDHFANIEAVQMLTLETPHEVTQMHSLYPAEAVTYAEDAFAWEGTNYYKYQEKLPVALEPVCNQYEFLSFVFSNREIEKVQPMETHILAETNNQILYFF